MRDSYFGAAYEVLWDCVLEDHVDVAIDLLPQAEKYMKSKPKRLLALLENIDTRRIERDKEGWAEFLTTIAYEFKWLRRLRRITVGKLHYPSTFYYDDLVVWSEAYQAEGHDED